MAHPSHVATLRGPVNGRTDDQQRTPAQVRAHEAAQALDLAHLELLRAQREWSAALLALAESGRAPAPSSPRLVTAAEAARVLGVSETTLRERVRPHVTTRRIGSAVRYDLASVEAYAQAEGALKFTGGRDG